MKRILRKIVKYSVIGLAAVFLASIGIDAADHRGAFSQSIVGKLIFQEDDQRCSSDMVFVPTESGGFCIDKYENSPNGKCQNRKVFSQADTRSNLDYSDCFPVSEKGAEPWRFISQTQAISACAKAGKRLPTAEEWFLASQGTPDLERNWDKNDCQVGNNWDNQPGFSGSGENCVSSYGAYDMIGNVWEWVKGEAEDGMHEGRRLPDSGYVASADSKGIPIEANKENADPNFNEDYFWIKSGGIRGMARGGYWENKADAGLYSLYLVSPPSFAGTGIGFRCAK